MYEITLFHVRLKIDYIHGSQRRSLTLDSEVINEVICQRKYVLPGTQVVPGILCPIFSLSNSHIKQPLVTIYEYHTRTMLHFQ